MATAGRNRAWQLLWWYRLCHAILHPALDIAAPDP
jgi:hypothetical protein